MKFLFNILKSLWRFITGADIFINKTEYDFLKDTPFVPGEYNKPETVLKRKKHGNYFDFYWQAKDKRTPIEVCKQYSLYYLHKGVDK